MKHLIVNHNCFSLKKNLLYATSGQNKKARRIPRFSNCFSSSSLIELVQEITADNNHWNEKIILIMVERVQNIGPVVPRPCPEHDEDRVP